MYYEELRIAHEKGSIFPRIEMWYNQKKEKYNKYKNDTLDKGKKPVSMYEYYETPNQEQRLYKVHEDYRANYDKYLREHPEEEKMPYEDWINNEILKNYKFDKNQRKGRVTYDMDPNDEPLSPGEYVRRKKSRIKFDNFGGKKKRTKRGKSRRSRRKRI
jgi:hypothetical protein